MEATDVRHDRLALFLHVPATGSIDFTGDEP